MQFSIGNLLAYISLCCVLAACSPVAGVASSVALMLFALALWWRHGFLALTMLSCAMLGGGPALDAPQGGFETGRFFVILLLASFVCGWYGNCCARVS
jgi:hypothetical protein